jgi:hypothetical protein
MTTSFKPMLSPKALAARLNTSLRSVYRMLQDGLAYHQIPGGIKVSESDLQDYLQRRKKCLSGETRKAGITYPSSEAGRAYIESALKARRGGTRRGRKSKSSATLIELNQKRYS